ncbi:MAG: T9SS type A sorting domain-containing protein [Flavobacteriales bacterium]
MRYFILVYIVLVLSVLSVNAQFSIGTWRDHLPYGKCVDLCSAGEKIFCATPYSVFVHTPSTGENFRISKVNYLSDVGIIAMEYDPSSGFVVVGYSNGNVDLIKEDQGINIPDIKFSSIIGDKAVYDILPYGNRVYLSTGFGIVVLDMVKLEVKETYFIGPNGGPIKVHDVAIYEETIYALTETGVLKANVNNTFLANFQNWQAFTDVPTGNSPVHIEFYDGALYLGLPGETNDIVYKKTFPDGVWEEFANYPNFRVNELWTRGDWFSVSGNYAYLMYQKPWGMVVNGIQHAGGNVNANNAIAVESSYVWCADNFRGLLREDRGEIETVVKPQGPASADSRRIGAFNNNVWIAHGGVNASWGNNWNQPGISGFVNDNWVVLSPDASNWTNHNDIQGLVDVMDVAVDPLDNNRILMGSWEEGLVEGYANGSPGEVRNGDGTNGLTTDVLEWIDGYTAVGGVAFDINGIAWCTNSYTTEGIHAMDRSGNFYDFNFNAVLTADDKIADLIITKNGIVWANVINKGLLALNTNGTLGVMSDDNYKLLTDEEGEGGLPSRDVLCMEEDLDGEVWVGTSQGLGIFYNQDAIFTEEGFDAEPILITQDGNVQELLGTETITCIEIDGSNRKWIGTQNSGVFLFSDDGLQQIFHFTTDNSPIFSNTIYDIGINHSNGEVFIATERGVIGFFSTATNFDPEMANVRVFPNPVRPDYTGNITIDGLAYNTSVKVTDIQGNLVFETESEGGRAVWDGKTFGGETLTSGVYLVYVTTPDGSADDVKQITIIR